MPAYLTPTSWWSRSVPTWTQRRRPAWSRVGTSSTREAGAFALRDVLEQFEGGRVVVGVTSTPFKCPPAPSEAALLVHEFLAERGLREDLVDLPRAPARGAGAAIPCRVGGPHVRLLRRGITFLPGRAVASLDPARKVALLTDGTEEPYDLFLGVPVHRVPAVVVASGLAVDGWVPVDSLTLQTAWPGVYAVGDVTSVGTPKAGVFAEGQAGVVADRIIAQARGVETTRSTTAAASATSSSVTSRWPRSTSRSSRASARSVTSKDRRPRSPRTSRSSARAGWPDGSLLRRRDEPAVDDEVGAGHVPGAVARQQDDEVGDLLRSGESTRGRLGCACLANDRRGQTLASATVAATPRCLATGPSTPDPDSRC